MRLRDAIRAILKGLASILVSTAEALRRQAQGSEDTPESQTQTAGKETGGPPAHWLERVKDARVWYGTDGKKPGNGSVPGSRHAPRSRPPVITDESPGRLPSAKDVLRPSTHESDARQPGRAREEQPGPPPADDSQPKAKRPGSKEPIDAPPPERRSFRLRRAGDRPEGEEENPKTEPRGQQQPGSSDIEPPASQPPILRPRLRSAQPSNPIFRTTDNEKPFTAGEKGAPRLAGNPRSDEDEGALPASPRIIAGHSKQAWDGLRLSPPGINSMDDASIGYDPPGGREWSFPPARYNVPGQYDSPRASDLTAQAREIWPDLSRVDESPSHPRQTTGGETGAFALSAHSRWPDLPADTSDMNGAEAARERWEAEQRERQHEQRLEREQRGDLWSE